VTWVAVWVVFFPLLVPSEPRRSAWASFLAATTVPFVLVGSLLVNGIPETVRPWVLEYLGNLIVPTYICAGASIIGSRVLYKLTHELSVARRMGSYQLVERLGAGGMGEVWKAKHRMLARPGAIKIIRPDALGGGSDAHAAIVMKRFEQEAQATASLRSPHTIDLYDFGITDEGNFFYVMELLDGIDMKTLVEKHGPIPVERAAFLLRQVCQSLAEAHARGLIHRDIKPANIFVCQQGLEYDFVKVLDFGLVKRTGSTGNDTAQLTGAGIAPGTPTFMPPEMAHGGLALDARTDLYALGCVAYWLVTGQLVFEGESPMAIIIRHVQDPPPPPSTRTELPIPPEFDRIVLDCLEKDPSRRPQTAGELSLRLRDCERQMAIWTQEQAERWWRLRVPSAGLELQATSCAELSDTSEVQRSQLDNH
jgi:serine/threonine-protein kinase